MTRPTRAEIDLGALRHNYRQIRTLLPRNVRIMPAIKADAYEHGAVRCARALADVGADAFGVAIVEEGIQLRETGVNVPILIFSAMLVEQLPLALRFGLMPTVSDAGFAEEVARAAARRGCPAAIHVKVDTGMGRVGILHQEAVEVISRIADVDGIVLEGIYTHFATADEADKTFTREQMRIFDGILLRLKERGITFRYRHAANSGALLDVPAAYYDMARPGILLYGLYPSPEATRRLMLRQVMTIKTNITLLKRFPKGYGISYGRTYTTPGERLIATLPIGYEDGFFRVYSNQAEVLVRGQRAPVVGRVCMDQTLVDVTDAPGVQVGDEVVIYGGQGDEFISIEDAAQLAGTIPYEVVTLVGKRVPRIYIE
ncbi:MAG TPA: alanine racemase [Candidatus Brocadiia bacterium]|nr:alanine racemase [Candidatus Brocadiia bacterium]